MNKLKGLLARLDYLRNQKELARTAGDNKKYNELHNQWLQCKKDIAEETKPKPL